MKLTGSAKSAGKVSLGEGSARTGLQIVLETTSDPLVLEFDRDDKCPRLHAGCVNRLAGVVGGKPLGDIRSQTNVVTRRFDRTSKHVDETFFSLRHTPYVGKNDSNLYKPVLRGRNPSLETEGDNWSDRR